MGARCGHNPSPLASLGRRMRFPSFFHASRAGQGGTRLRPFRGVLFDRKEGQMVWTTIAELAREGHVSKDRLYELARREDDPLPLRYLDGGGRYGQVLVSEFDEWVRRNGALYNERRSV